MLERLLTAAVVAVALAACSGSGDAPVNVRAPVEAGVRAESSLSAGATDALAAELLISSGALPATPLRARGAVGEPELAAAVAAAAHDHLRSVALGAGAGPDLLGAQRIRRLAQDPAAPPDANRDGSNLDETLAAEMARVSTYAGRAAPVGLRQPLFPWQRSSSVLRAPMPAVADPAPSSWRTERLVGADARVLLEDVAGALRARALAAGELLATGRGGLAGATADEGLLGLVLVEQLLAIEEQLLTTLFSSGGPLGPLGDVETYDPRVEPRWLPVAFAAVLEPGSDERPAGFRVIDGASDLTALATVLEASAETLWFSGPANPSPAVQQVFATVFPPPAPTNPPKPVLSWQVEIQPLIRFRCGGCHLGFGSGGFVIDTLATTLNGSPRSRFLNLPMVVPGDHTQSLLYNILVGPPSPIRRMPLGSSLPPAEIQRIADWIDQGAFEEPPAPPAPPVPGEDLATVSFRNLVALHLDRATGALLHRRESDGGSGVATAVATGHALVALRRLQVALPGLEFDGLTVGAVLEQAAAFAVEQLLDSHGRARAEVVLADGAAPRAADLRGQAALVAGLMAASETAPGGVLDLAARAAAASLLDAFFDPVTDLPLGYQRLSPERLADVVAALGAAVARGVPGAGEVQDHLLAALRPALLPAEWSDGALGDGVADTDGDGIDEPAAAGRLPVLSAAVLVGDPAAAVPFTEPVTWSQHVRPLLLANCGDCHMGGNAQGSYAMDTARMAAIPGDSAGALPLIVPGDAERSLLYRKLVDRLPPIGAQMPLLATPLDARAREMVRQWIEAGASAR